MACATGAVRAYMAEAAELSGWAATAWGFALSGPGQLLFAGVIAILALKALMRILALVLTLALFAMLFGDVGVGDIAYIGWDFARRLILAAAAFRQG